MKKQKLQLIILLVILAALAAGFFGLRQYNEAQSKLPVEDNSISVTDVAKEDIVRITYDQEGETYSFEKQDDTWYYTEDTSLNINQTTISAMLGRVAGLTSEQVIENVTDMSQYGLDTPTKTIQYETASQSGILYVGDYNSVSKVYYLCKPSETTVYTVESAIVTVFSNTLEDLVVEEEVEETEEVKEEVEAATET